MVYKLGGSGNKSDRRKKAIKKARKKFFKTLPESEVNPNGQEDFEALLFKAATTILKETKPRKLQKSRRDKSVKVEKGMFKKK